MADRRTGAGLRFRELAICLSATLSSAHALGATAASAKKKADSLKKEAFHRLAVADYQKGIEHLEAAHQAYPHPDFLFNIAVAYDQWEGHCAEALSSFTRFFEACADCPNRIVAEQRKAKTEERCLARLAVETLPDDAEIRAAGNVVGRSPIELRLAPGSYEITATKLGYLPQAERLELAQGDKKNLVLRLEPEGAAVVRTSTRAPPRTASVKSTTETMPPLRVAAWVVTAAGAGGVITGTALAIVAVKSTNTARDAEDSGIRKAEIFALQDKARLQAAGAWIGFGVGLAGVAAALLCFLLPVEDGAALAVGASPAGIAIGGRF